MKFHPSPCTPRSVLVTALPLLLMVAFNVDVDVEAVTGTGTSRNNMVLSAAKECNPNEAQSRLTGSTSCGPGSHCVFDGNSSLDGYCNENDDYPKGAAADDMQLDMPESMAVLCSVCEAPDAHGNTVWHVTKPHDRVGAFDCLELDGLGKEGRISGSQCHLFQQMIQANNLCGCIAPSSTTTSSSTSTSASDVTEPQDDNALFYADFDEENAPYTPSSVASVAEGSSFDTRSSGSLSKPILAITGAAASVIAYLAAA